MRRRKTTEEFIEEARKIHGEKYDYSKVNYINNSTKVCIIDSETKEEFWQTPHGHLVGKPRNKITTKTFIKKAQSIHGDKYDYSKVIYEEAKIKVCIICPVHGEFWQTPDRHLHGSGCPKCAGTEKVSTESFIERAKEIHGDKYDYSSVDYKNSETKVNIICPVHGEFWQYPLNHVKGCGCPKCANNVALTTEEFIQKAKKIHGNKYDYSKVNYINNHTKVCIIDPESGEFWQTPQCHLENNGHASKLTTKKFIEKSKEIHGNKYDYSKVEYVNLRTKVCLTCPTHGDFYQRPDNHLYNQHGCPYCNESKLELKVRQTLEKHELNYESQKKWNWLKFDLYQSVDFYLPDYNCVIECQGIQHFETVKRFSGYSLEKRILMDKNKRDLCEQHGIRVLYYSNLGIEYPYEVYEDIENLIDEIKKINLTN